MPAPAKRTPKPISADQIRDALDAIVGPDTEAVVLITMDRQFISVRSFGALDTVAQALEVALAHADHPASPHRRPASRQCH